MFFFNRAFRFRQYIRLRSCDKLLRGSLYKYSTENHLSVSSREKNGCENNKEFMLFY